MSEFKRLNSLPVFPSPPAPGDFADWRLRMGGLIKEPFTVSYREILTMPAREVTADFQCEAEPIEEPRYIEDGSCYQSVKWVDRLELITGDRTEKAHEIALARLRRRAGGAA